MAQAILELYGDKGFSRDTIKMGIGPVIENGFYYDFDLPEALKFEELETLELKMREIIKRDLPLSKFTVSREQALGTFEGRDRYKTELIEGLPAGEIISFYRQGTESDFTDLCRGPHLPRTGLIPAHFKLTATSGAYWRGSEKNPMLQRIYGVAFSTAEELEKYVWQQEEAKKRDHRKLGAELDLFSFPEEIGSGLAVFHPKGGIIRREMENYSRQRHEEEGYDFVYTPHITKANLFETSGHLAWYADGMFPPMHLDEARNEEGEITRQGADYYLKPMNCPFHILVYRSSARSYRDLPLRMFEFGTVYRNEKSGVIHGLTRVRGLTMDDAHIFTTKERMKEELTSTLNFVLSLLRDYGLTDFYLELSTKDPEKYVGDDAMWEEATATLLEVATDSGLELVPDPGGAAFYGPKISVQARDAIGRTWQMSTVQLDFNLPERFELEYTAADGSRQRPVMIHRALFGSIERFFGVLTEHYAGAFPIWLAPVQVVAIPVAEAYNDYLFDVVAQLRRVGVRADIDASAERMQKKIRTHTLQKVPYQLIAGEADAANGSVSFRFRDGTQENNVPVDEAIARIVTAIKDRAQV